MWRNVRGCPPPRCRSHSAARTRSSPPPANGCSRPRVSLITSPRPTPVVWPAARPERWGCTPSTCSSNGRRAAIWRISPPRTSSSVRMCWCTRCMPTRCNAASRWNAGIAARPCCWARRSRAGQWLDYRYRRPGGRFGSVSEPRHGCLPLARLCRSIPVVRIGETDGELPSADVICDNEGGIEALVDHLVDVHGVTEMSFIG